MNALVKIERQAFALAHQGKRQEATELLTNAEYLRLKKIYAGGMDKTVNAANGLIEREIRQVHAMFFWFAAPSGGQGAVRGQGRRQEQGVLREGGKWISGSALKIDLY